MTVAPFGPEQWEAIYRAEFSRVYRAVLAVVRDREVALDALQDAFVEGVKRPPQRNENIAGWLFRVALRRSRRGPYRGWLTGLKESVRLSEKDEIGALLDRMEAAQLLGMLSERQRAMVVAQYYLGLDQEEIARRFGIRRGTVAATLAQARARMRTGGQDAS